MAGIEASVGFEAFEAREIIVYPNRVRPGS